MSLLRGVKILGTSNEEIQSLSGALNVHVAEVHTSPINDYFYLYTGINTTLSANASIGAISITVSSAVGFSIGDTIELNSSSSINTHFTKIVNIVGSVLYLNRPLGHSRVIGDTVKKIQTNIKTTAGSMASPISYKAKPSLLGTWNILSISIDMTFGTAGDLGLFGNQTALTNGCVLRRYDGASATYSTVGVWQSNSDISLDASSVTFQTRSGGGGTYGMTAKLSGLDYGAIIKLDYSAGDYLELLVQDDITALILFRVKVQGHLEGA